MDEQVIKLLKEILSVLEDIRSSSNIMVEYSEQNNDKLKDVYHKLKDIEKSID